MRLIDADALADNLGEMWGIPRDWDGNIDETCEEAFDAIENAPTVDAAPITEGKWIADEADVLFHCSVCGTQISNGWDYEGFWNYCPECGARMCGSYEQ